MIYALLGIIGVFAGMGGVNNADTMQGIILSMVIGALGFLSLIHAVKRN
jgi:hypothetical protein